MVEVVKELSKGWVESTLGEIGRVSMCKRILKKETSATGDIPFFKIGTFGKEPNAFITNEIYQDFKDKYSFPKKGDILISASGTIGRRVIYDGKPAYFQDSNIVWIDNDGKVVLNEYLYMFYGACDWNPSKGATIARLYNDNLRRIKIQFPKSLDEQKRIVALLDTVFSDLEQARVKTEQNLKNARELFDSYLQQVFSQKGDGWVEDVFDNILEIRSGRNQKAVLDPNGEYPIYGSAGKVMGWANSYICEKNTTIIGRKGTINSPMYMTTKFWNVDTAFGLIAGKKLDNKFLYYFCKGYDFSKLDKGTTLPSLVKKDLVKITMSFPKLNEQVILSKKLDYLSFYIQKVEGIYKEKLNSIDELKKSILQKAFSGELTDMRINDE